MTSVIIPEEDQMQGPRGFRGVQGRQGNQGNQGDQGIPGSGMNMPWWVRAISVFGVPASIALYLVWTLNGTQARTLDTMREGQIKHNIESAQSNLDTKASSARVETYLRVICGLQAKTKEDKNTCNSVR